MTILAIAFKQGKTLRSFEENVRKDGSDAKIHGYPSLAITVQKRRPRPPSISPTLSDAQDTQPDDLSLEKTHPGSFYAILTGRLTADA